MNNGADDAIEVATAPLHIPDAVPLLTSQRFTRFLVDSSRCGAASYALDQTMKSHLRDVSFGSQLLQDLSYDTVSGATALLYGWGLYSGNACARNFAITADEAAENLDPIKMSQLRLYRIWAECPKSGDLLAADRKFCQ